MFKISQKSKYHIKNLFMSFEKNKFKDWNQFKEKFGRELLFWHSEKLLRERELCKWGIKGSVLLRAFRNNSTDSARVLLTERIVDSNFVKFSKLDLQD